MCIMVLVVEPWSFGSRLEKREEDKQWHEIRIFGYRELHLGGVFNNGAVQLINQHNDTLKGRS